jgi:(4S)-4-hydroxy-5-phosphonooxypentane-2,3-dione isomerase
MKMHTTLVHMRVKPEHVEAFIEACRFNHEASVREPGCLRFDFLQDPEDPTRFMFYEAYRSEHDAALHKQTLHYAAWRDSVAGMMAEPRRGERMAGLLPKG